MKIMQKRLIRFSIVSLALLLCGLLMTVSVIAAYTDDIQIKSATITTSSKSGYDYELDFTLEFRLNDNYTTLKIYTSITEDGYSSTVSSTVITYSNYVNATSGTSGLVSQTGTLYFEDGDIPNTAKDDNLIFKAYIYNASIDSSNLLDSDSYSVNFPYTVTSTSAAEDTTTSNLTWLLLGGIGVLVLVAIVFILRGRYQKKGRR